MDRSFSYFDRQSPAWVHFQFCSRIRILEFRRYAFTILLTYYDFGASRGQVLHNSCVSPVICSMQVFHQGTIYELAV